MVKPLKYRYDVVFAKVGENRRKCKWCPFLIGRNATRLTKHVGDCKRIPSHKKQEYFGLRPRSGPDDGSQAGTGSPVVAGAAPSATSQARSSAQTTSPVIEDLRQRELLVNLLRQEYQRIEDMRNNLMGRLKEYRKAGLLNPQQVCFIRNESEQTLILEELEAQSDGVVLEPIPQNRSSGQQIRYLNPDSEQEQQQPVPSVSVSSPLELQQLESEVDEELLMTIKDEDMSANSLPEGLSCEEDDQADGDEEEDPLQAFARKMIDGLSATPGPMVCPFCHQQSSDKESLLSHMFGDKRSNQPATCPGFASSASVSLIMTANSS